MTMAVTGRRRLAHIPALDGLRGLAVVAVLLFHGGLSWATGGFIGVDAFFVLSGFLITSLLLSEQRATGTIGLGGFWARRARRLLPALLLVVAAVAVATPLFDPSAQVALRGDALAALAYVANWHFVAQGADYFGRTAADSPLDHLWSLAIEEQFYLVWPLVVLGLARLRRAATWVGVVAGSGAVASVAAMVLLHGDGDDPSRVYFGTDTRAHTVLIGAVLAVLLAPRAGRPAPSAAGWPRADRLLLGAVTLVAVFNLMACVALVKGDQSWLYEGGLPLFSVATAILIAHAVLVPEGVLAWTLSLSPLRAIGRLSYGLYLWHWPINLLLTGARTGLTGEALLVVRLAATGAVAYASYRLVELPIRDGRLRGRWAGVSLPVAAAAALAVVLVATLGVPGIAPPDVDTELAASSPGPARPAGPTAEVTPSAGPRPPRTRAPGEPVRVLVLGDSVGLTLVQGMASQAAKQGVAITEAALLGCGVARGGPLRHVGQEQKDPPACQTWPAQWSGALQEHDPDVALVVVGRWEVVDRSWNGRWAHLGEPDFDAYIEGELETAVRTVAQRGAHVALATAPYYLRGERPDGGRWPEDDPRRVDRMNELIRAVARRHAKEVTIVDLNEKTAKAGGYSRSIDGVQVRYDGVHFSPGGSRWLAPWLLPQLVALGPTVVPGQPTSTLPTTTTVPKTTSTRAPTTTRPARTTTTRPPPLTTTSSTSPPSTFATTAR